MDPRTRQFIEHMGLFTETEGLPRIAGRILGLLLVTPDACSLDEMAETLGVSKASISTDARRLEQRGLLVRTSRPGDRRDYYAMAPDAIQRSLESKLRGIRKFREILQEARTLPLADSAIRERIEDWDAAHQATIDSVAELIDKMERRKPTASRRR
jgi:DNA-binding transcriptional regulator GbsR (MarR family)